MGVLVIALLAVGAYWAFMKRVQAPGTSEAERAAVPATTTLPSGTSTADAALQQDTSAIDAQLNAFGSDNASIKSGLNDTQVPQSSL